MLSGSSASSSSRDTPGQTHESHGKYEVLWNTTLLGSGLASASFLKPITRAKAETLFAGALDRAAAYNVDPGKPVWIERISLFGPGSSSSSRLV